MAEKKTLDALADVEETKANVTKAKKKVEPSTALDSDYWKEMVEIRLPKAVKGEPNFIIASVNGKTFKIQKGVKVEVPAPIAEVIENSYLASEEAEAYASGLVK